MARLLYALSGQGRGHTSRVMAVSTLLRERGHEVVFCGGGTARRILEERGEAVIPVPPLEQVMRENRVCLAETIVRNGSRVLTAPVTVARLAARFREQQADLLVCDFEAFTPHAALRIDLPVVSLNHQEVVTQTRYQLPPRFLPQALLTNAVVRCIAPQRPLHRIVSSFFFPPVRDPATTTLVGPVIRPAVEALVQEDRIRDGDDVLVYFNQTEGAAAYLDALAEVDETRFVVYNFEPPEDAAERYPNLRFEPPSLDGFLDDLARARAVICTAGFTLTSEALFLGKPLLVVPNRGIFEQTLNALFLQRDNLGSAALDGLLTPSRVRAFLLEAPRWRRRPDAAPASGTREVVDLVEDLLLRILPASVPLPALPASAGAPSPSNLRTVGTMA